MRLFIKTPKNRINKRVRRVSGERIKVMRATLLRRVWISFMHE